MSLEGGKVTLGGFRASVFQDEGRLHAADEYARAFCVYRARLSDGRLR